MNEIELRDKFGISPRGFADKYLNDYKIRNGEIILKGRYKMDVKTTINKLEKVREEKDMNKQKFAVIELDTPYQTYMRWLNETNTSSGDNLAKIYEYLEDESNE